MAAARSVALRMAGALTSFCHAAAPAVATAGLAEAAAVEAPSSGIGMGVRREGGAVGTKSVPRTSGMSSGWSRARSSLSVYARSCCCRRRS